jgi:putative tryptophan/tyrosine transport system substrate-binding protein
MTFAYQPLSWLALCALLWAGATEAQQAAKTWRIGMLFTAKQSSRPVFYRSFVESMRSVAKAEGVDLQIEERYAEDSYDRLSRLAAELVLLNLDVLIAHTGPAVEAAKRATDTIPIVMAATSDPVGRKFIASLSRPGGNVTGPASMGFDLLDKHVELLRIALPNAKSFAVLSNPDNRDHQQALELARRAAARYGLRMSAVPARSAVEIDAALATIAKSRAEAVIIAPDVFLAQQAARISQSAIKARLPTVYWSPVGIAAGGMLAYGPDPLDDARKAVSYTVRLIKGAKPAEMPVEQPTKLELVINRKTAAAIGLEIPAELLLRADRVID